jgi:4'-phosphopantetheinyl transferase
MANRSDILYPVILAVPESGRNLRGRDNVRFLSSHARHAAVMAAGRAGVRLDVQEKDADGVPLPWQGVHWSIAHKPDYVAGVVALEPVGIDVEPMRAYKAGLERKIASPAEWALAGGHGPDVFSRYWTAKESVLKAVGLGLRGLSDCRVVDIADDSHLRLEGFGKVWVVEHCFFDGHVAAVVADGHDIDWQIVMPG